MTNKNVRLLVALGLLVSAPGISFAGAGHDHAMPATTESKEGAQGEDVHSHDRNSQEFLVDLKKAVAAATIAIDSGMLDRLHDITEDITHAASHVAEKAPAQSKTRVTGAAKNIESLANMLHKQADAGDVAKVQSTLKKLQAMVVVLESQLK